MSEYRNPNSAPRRPQQSRPAGQRPPQGNRRPVKRRKKSKAPILILAVIVVLAALVLGILAGTGAFGKKDSAQEAPASLPENQTAGTNPAEEVDVAALSAMLGEEGHEVTGLTQNQMIEVTDLCGVQNLDPEWMNVLLLGGDARSLTESSRSDTMIICSINTTTGQVKLASLMRDTAITYDDMGKYNGTYRLNTANFFGGPRLVMRVLNQRLGLNLEYYALVNFTSFSIIAEKLGGIELDVSEAEMEQINKNAADQYRFAKTNGIDETELEATNVLLEEYGENIHLNGRQVLAFARIRKIDSDYSRVERQQKVLTAMLKKMMGKSAQEILGIVTTLAQYVDTNLSIGQIISTATTVLGSGLSDVPQMRMPVNNSYVQETREGESMLYDTNWELNKIELHSFIYE